MNTYEKQKSKRGKYEPFCPCNPALLNPPPEQAQKKSTRRVDKSRRVTVIQDTREQTPLTMWPDFVTVERGTIHTGDYTLKGYETSVAIERKSLADLVGTMLGGYKSPGESHRAGTLEAGRFNWELERLRSYDLRAIIVVGTTWDELRRLRTHSGEDFHEAVAQFAVSVSINYGIQVQLFGSEEEACWWVATAFRHYIKRREHKFFARTERKAAANA